MLLYAHHTGVLSLLLVFCITHNDSQAVLTRGILRKGVNARFVFFIVEGVDFNKSAECRVTFVKTVRDDGDIT